MRNNKILIGLITLLVCLMATAAIAGGVKERMKERKPIINALLAKGIVGENNKGYLEFRGAPQQQDIVSAENSDRTAVYQAIAKKNGTTVENVGKLRAEHTAQRAHPGTWLQDPGGGWYQK